KGVDFTQEYPPRTIRLVYLMMELMKQKTLNCNGKLLHFDVPAVMGILNVTDDSFYDGGRYRSDREVLERTTTMVEEGAQIIDIGVMSTRPGAIMLPEEEERVRAESITNLLRKNFPNLILSIDTQRTAVVL